MTEQARQAGTGVPQGRHDWLTAREACALLGVSSATLRRWNTQGLVPAFTTPGGHRRFARAAILGMLPAEGDSCPDVAALGGTPDRIARAVRRGAGEVRGDLGWLAGVPARDVEVLRRHGRRVTAALLAAMDGATAEDRRVGHDDANAAATAFGVFGARHGASVGETVGAFLRFRMLFVTELGRLARRRALDAQQTADLLVLATRTVDDAVASLISGWESAGPGSSGRRAADDEEQVLAR